MSILLPLFLFFPTFILFLIIGEFVAGKKYLPKFTTWWRNHVITENEEWD